ncbi:MAG: leucine-rich repeat domain-containing protein [Chthoniobacter sp.]|nr:leucine-rich repeat domain-containing protein [Chthoniobacter sp.]
MSPELLPIPDRFRWWRWLGWALLVAVLATCGWSVWRAYDYRAAVREARAAGFNYVESPTPFARIRANWQAAFHLATWTNHTRALWLPVGKDLAPLRPLLLRLDPIHLQAAQCRNVNALRGLTRLRVLNISGLEVADLAPLAELTQLQTLYLGDCKGVTDLAPLAGLTQLQTLSLNNCTGVTDLTPLAGLTRLQTLSLDGCTGVADLAPLAGLAQLDEIRLGGCTGLSTEALAAFQKSHMRTTVFGSADYRMRGR